MTPRKEQRIMKYNQNRNQFLGCRVSASELEEIKSLADQCQLSVSDYLRQQAKEDPIIQIYDPKELLNQMIAIGRNINQIARLCNVQQNVKSDQINKIQDEWNNVRVMVLDFISRGYTTGR